MMPKRDFSLDILRIMAFCMIVFMHSPMPSDNASGPFLMALSYFTAPGIGLFFMVSGALLLPVKTDYISFIKRRLSKILLPTLLWTLIYLAVNLYYSQSEINIVRSIFSIPFSAQGNGVLWFMYTLTGLYLLAPILSAWLEKASPREIEIILSLWAMSLCYPILENWLYINPGSTGLLYYFTGYAGYFLLGFYLKHYAHRLSIAIPASVTLTGLALILILKRQGIEFDFYRLFWYESIFIASFSCLIWKIVTIVKFKSTPNEETGHRKSRLFIKHLSNAGFGIYLMHILIMRQFLWHMEWITSISNYSLQTIIIALLTLIISTALCLLMARIPVLNLLVGYRMGQANHRSSLISP